MRWSRRMVCGLVVPAVSLAIAMLPVTARVAKGVNPIANWPALKARLHSQADSKAVTLSRGASLTLDASNAVLAPNLSVLQVNSVNDPTVVVPKNGVLTFAVDVPETTYVSGAVSIAADPADIRPGLRAYVLSDTTVVGAPMIYQQAPPGGQVNFSSPGVMPDNNVALRTWRLDPGRHYISVAGPHCRAAGTFESIQLQGLNTIAPRTPAYSFAAISDIHIGQRAVSSTQLGNTFKALRQEGISFAMLTGDMTDHGRSMAGQFGVLASAITAGGGLDVYGCIGNHDSYVSTARPAAKAIPGLFPTNQTNYAFNQGPLRFVVCDGSYWLRANMEFVDSIPSDRIGIGMSPEGEQWLVDTLAEDTTTPTVVVSHYPFVMSPGETQCGYTMDYVSVDFCTSPRASGGQINDIISAAPNVIATLSGHTHFNHVEVWQNNFGDDITSYIIPCFNDWPAAYQVFRVYSDGDDIDIEVETRLADNMGYVLTSNYDLQGQPDTDRNPANSPAGSWAISTSYGIDLVSARAPLLITSPDNAFP